MKNLRKELDQFYITNGVFQRVNIEATEEIDKLRSENRPLPEGVYLGELGQYYKLARADLSEQELSGLFLYFQAKHLNTIKNCLLYFVAVSVISIFIGLLGLLIAIH